MAKLEEGPVRKGGQNPPLEPGSPRPAPPMGSHGQAIIDAYDAEQKRILTSRWAIGWRDRGMGHGDYGVIVEGDSGNSLVGNVSRELAEHLVDLHNASLPTEAKTGEPDYAKQTREE